MIRNSYRKSLIAIVLALIVGHHAVDCCAQSLRDWRQLASQMVDQEIVAAGVKNERVIRAMRDTPRHEFVAANQRDRAYFDMALPIGNSQTISPPFVVASMTEAIDPQPGDRVLEIGTGSGYQAAILSPLVQDVYTIEIVDELSRRATRTLKRLRYDNVHTRSGDGYLGWPEAAPFDKIIVTCSPEKVPQPLVDQLREGGLMVVPVGERYQQTLYLMRKTKGKLSSEALRATLFVPMTGAAESQRKIKPDPADPRITNGSFEEVATEKNIDGNQAPAGWHYQRQLTLKFDGTAPDGKYYVTFHNAEPGRGCHALQGFAVDGRQVTAFDVRYWVRGNNIRQADGVPEWPRIVITFYDDRRATIGEESIGAFSGSFGWREESGRIRVPLKAREAILRIGLLGAVGELSLDAVRLQVAPAK
jgi:protein-L-isoaspartate(D-aspartate) O-methyltransferase